MRAQQAILEFWFEGVDAGGAAGEAVFARWFAGGPAFDEQIRKRFIADIEAALRGDRDDWEESEQGALALVLLLDQFTRNVGRDTARAFAGDGRALPLSTRLVETGAHLAYRPIERYFLYLPFEHAEDRAEQARCRRLFTELQACAPEGQVDFYALALDYARKHEAVIERFGRFPSRNAALGRESTAEELAFLEEHGPGF